MARGLKGNSKPVERTAADRARIQAIRERYAGRPSPDALAASGDFEDTVQHGTYLRVRALCHQLKQARIAAGMTLADVAERTGIDVGALSRLENGRNANPTTDTLGRCAAAVGMTLALSLE